LFNKNKNQNCIFCSEHVEGHVQNYIAYLVRLESIINEPTITNRLFSRKINDKQTGVVTQEGCPYVDISDDDEYLNMIVTVREMRGKYGNDRSGYFEIWSHHDCWNDYSLSEKMPGYAVFIRISAIWSTPRTSLVAKTMKGWTEIEAKQVLDARMT
jgi:hypothetical protein